MLKTPNQVCSRLRFAGLMLLAAILACNAPAPDADTAIPAQPLASASPAPATAVPYDPQRALEILDSYPSLAAIKSNLDEINFVLTADSSTWHTGRQLLEYLLVERAYDPAAPNSVKRGIVAELDRYEMGAGPKTYLINLATGLTAEAQGLYPWSLRDYSAEEILNLFIELDVLDLPVGGYAQGILPQNMPNALHHWYPSPNEIVTEAHYRQFHLAQHLAAGAANQEQAVAAVVVWMQANFFHAYAPGYGWEVYLDGQAPRNDGGAVAYPLTLDRIYEERVSGCHEPTMLMEGILHSLNIPALRLAVHGHGVLYLPTLDRYVHGDHVVAYHDAPPGMLLLTPEEFRPFAENPAHIYAIVYPDKYSSPLLSMPISREGASLYVHAENLRDPVSGGCLQVSPSDWERVSAQLREFNLQYDNQTCTLTSDRVPIQSLDVLSAPAP